MDFVGTFAQHCVDGQAWMWNFYFYHIIRWEEEDILFILTPGNFTRKTSLSTYRMIVCVLSLHFDTCHFIWNSMLQLDDRMTCHYVFHRMNDELFRNTFFFVHSTFRSFYLWTKIEKLWLSLWVNSTVFCHIRSTLALTVAHLRIQLLKHVPYFHSNGSIQINFFRSFLLDISLIDFIFHMSSIHKWFVIDLCKLFNRYYRKRHNFTL